MTAMIKKGLDISPIITHKLPYSEWEEAFHIASQSNAGKVVLDWSSDV